MSEPGGARTRGYAGTWPPREAVRAGLLRLRQHQADIRLAAERALNVKAYISGGEAKQNIDASRIETRTGNEGTMTSEQWIVPAGAAFPEADSTTPVDETKVKAVPDHPKPMAKKKKAQ